MDGVLVHQFAKETGIAYSTILYWIKTKGFPAKRKTLVEEDKILYVNIDDFWEWAEQNKELINFSELEENILGAEPEWVKTMRERDRRNIVKINSNKKFWTEEEEKRLINMLEEFRYTNADIAKVLRRSEASVRRKIYDLGLKIRPLSNEYKLWTGKETTTLIEMHKKGYGLNVIAEELNRSERSVRGKLERMKEEA